MLNVNSEHLHFRTFLSIQEDNLRSDDYDEKIHDNLSFMLTVFYMVADNYRHT